MSRFAGRRSRLAPVVALAIAATLAIDVSAADLTARLPLTFTPFVRDARTGADETRVTVRNPGGDPVSGPLRLVLDGGQPADVGLAHPDGRDGRDGDDGADYAEVPLPDGVLAAGASATVAVPLVANGRPVTRADFRVEGTVLSATTARRLTVVTDRGTLDDLVPRDARFAIFVDGYARGTTDASGRATLLVPREAAYASTRLPGETWKGSAPIPKPRDTNPVTVVIALDDGAEGGFDASLRIDEVSRRILRRNVPRITLRVIDRGIPVRLRGTDFDVTIEGAGGSVDLTALFKADADGALSTPSAPFREAIGRLKGPLTMALSAQSSDATPVEYFDLDTTFAAARARVVVQLRPPASDPMWPLDGMRVTAALKDSDVRVSAVADARGRATLADLPTGDFVFEALRVSGDGTKHRAVAAGTIGGDTVVELVLPVR